VYHFVGPVVSVEAVVERQEASEVSALGLDSGGRLAGDLASEVQLGEGSQAPFGFGKPGWNVML
jgi:hypothetical protein